MSVKHPYLKQLKAYVLRFSEQKGPIKDENSSVLPFFKTLEDIVQSGLKPVNSFLNGVTVRYFWHWASLLPKNVPYSKSVASLNCAIEQTAKNDKVTTDRGRGRVLLRAAVNAGILASAFRLLQMCPQLIADFYDPCSIVGDEILCEMLISLLEPLSFCSFALNIRNASFLDETWELGTFKKFELVPCKKLGVTIECVNRRLIVTEVDPNSVADEHLRIEAGDLIDELFGQSMQNASRRKFTTLLSEYEGSPTYIAVIKCIGPDGFIFQPLQGCLQSAGLCRKALLANHQRRLKDPDSRECCLSPTNEKGQYLVKFCGFIDVGPNGNKERIGDGVPTVLEKAERRDVIFDLGETGVTVTCRSSSNILLHHSFPEISSCGRRVDHPLHFAYNAGETTCTLAKKFVCFVFEAMDEDQAINEKLEILSDGWELLAELSLQWILDKQDISKERAADLQKVSEDEYQKIMIFYANIIQALGENLKVRQQVIATATVYFKRFYARNSLKCIDPLLMAPTCVFLASKVEEFGLISHSKLLGACQIVVKNNNYAFQQEFPYRIPQILEAEFFLLEMMDCCLIVYHPYRQLVQLMQDIGNDEALLSFTWKIINDSLRSDVSLLYAPYQIALAALHIAAAVLNKDLKTWFAELSVDMDKIFEVVRIILGLYELWKQFDDRKEMFGILQKMPKPNSQPSRPPSAQNGSLKTENN